MKIETICVCGAGTMGSGIAQVVALHGFNTILFDVNAEVLQAGYTTITQNVDKLFKKGALSGQTPEDILSRITVTGNLHDCRADLVIEAIVEKEAAKVQLFNNLASINIGDTIFATNTSSLSVSAIAAQVKNPQRVAGMHFFNPPYLMKLVEVVQANETSIEVIQALCSLATKLNKTAVVCKDVPGFIVNRVARQYYLEALRMVEDGLADTSTIDALLEATGFKMGPFALMDMIGIDINYTATCSVFEALGRPPRLQPSSLQGQMVQQGRLGRKTGKGFYEY